jgi:NADH-quinone oxidoreductase subunit L
VLAAFGGFMNTPFFHGLGNFLHPVFEGVSEQHAPEGSLEYILIGVSVAVAVAGAAVAWMFYRGDADARTHLLDRMSGPLGFLDNGWGINSGYEKVIVAPLARAAEGMSWFDGKVIDGAVNGVAGGVHWLGGKLQGVQTGFVRQYGVGLLAGAIGLVVWVLMGGGS